MIALAACIVDIPARANGAPACTESGMSGGSFYTQRNKDGRVAAGRRAAHPTPRHLLAIASPHIVPLCWHSVFLLLVCLTVSVAGGRLGFHSQTDTRARPSVRPVKAACRPACAVSVCENVRRPAGNKSVTGRRLSFPTRHEGRRLSSAERTPCSV